MKKTNLPYIKRITGDKQQCLAGAVEGLVVSGLREKLKKQGMCGISLVKVFSGVRLTAFPPLPLRLTEKMS